jgi:hypothetical protein
LILFVGGGKTKPGGAVIFFNAAAIVLVCPTAKLRQEWIALNRPNWLRFKPALTTRTYKKIKPGGPRTLADSRHAGAVAPSRYGQMIVGLLRLVLPTIVKSAVATRYTPGSGYRTVVARSPAIGRMSSFKEEDLKTAQFYLALLILTVFATSSFAGQGHGQGGRPGGAPSNPGIPHQPSNPGGRGHSESHHPGNPVVGIDNHGKSSPGSGNAGGNGVNRADAKGFRNYGQYVAAQHVSENLGIPFGELKAKMTGTAAVSLGKAIHQLRPDLRDSEVKAESKKAEQASRHEVQK